MNNIKAIFIKQFTSHIKIPVMIAQGLMFLIMAAAIIFFLAEDPPRDCDVCIPAYVCATCEEEEAARFRLPIPSQIGVFAIIFVGMALVNSTSAIVQEDKATTNLRFMAMANVKPYQYLIATMASSIIIVPVMLVLYSLVGGYFGIYMLRFVALGTLGGLVSILAGVVIGLSKVAVLAMPISLILGFGPTLSRTNEALAGILRFTFIQQVNIGMAELSEDMTSNFIIIGINGLVLLVVFAFMHRKNKFNV